MNDIDRRLTRLETSAGDSPTTRAKGNPDPELEALSFTIWPPSMSRAEAARDLLTRLRYVLSIAALHNGRAKATIRHLTEIHDVTGRPIKAPADAQWNEHGFIYLDAAGRQTDHFIRELHPRGMAFLPAYRKVEETAPGVSDGAMREMYKWLLREHLEDGKSALSDALKGLEELERLDILFMGVAPDLT